MKARDLCGAIAAAFLAGCDNPLQKFSTDVPSAILVPSAAAGIKDGRARFRDLFCAAARRDGVVTNSDCSEWLHRFPDEANPKDPGEMEANPPATLELLMVPGIFGECVQGMVTMFGDATAQLARLGYRSSIIPVRGRASSEHNAGIIREYVLRAAGERPGKRFLLITYSKGTADSLVALTTYPEMRPLVAALASFAGVVNGTPIADGLENLYENTAGKLPNADCPAIDDGEVRSLTRSERLRWLAAHPLPSEVAYFSVVALPTPDRVSAVLQGLHSRLSYVDPRNDSQVIYYDAIVPGSMLLAYANADHWAIALPFDSQAPVLARTLVTRSYFPRAQLLEATVKMVEGTLRRVAAAK